MISTAINTCRSCVRRVKPLWLCCQWLGVNRLARRWYESILLRKGIHDTLVMGCRLRFVVSTPQEIARIDDLSGEQEFVTRMLQSLRQGDVVFDIGANIGVVSLLFASASPLLEVEVHAFEPEPQNAAQLRKNVNLNPQGGRVHLHEVALSDRTGRASFYVQGDTGSGAHSLIGNEGATQIEVPLEQATTLADRLGVAPDVVKIDVEGAELSVLLGMDGLFRRGNVRDLFVELHSGKLRSQDIEPRMIQTWLEERRMNLAWERARGPEIHQHYHRAD